jgi:predicted KAP-like P-loop ATPase
MYHADSPILKQTEDRLQRRAFAADLARALVNLDYQDTFTVGLFGEWGSGKTSAINMMLEEIGEIGKRDKGNVPLVVKFEPWLFSDANQLVGQFLVHLANELNSDRRKKLKEAAREILKYKFMLDLIGLIPNGKPLADATKGAATLLAEKLQDEPITMDVAEQKEHIIELLKGMKRKIVVIIDDIDRLSSEQIRHVFQLITAVAKFPKMVYFLSFDRGIVVKALEKVQEGNGSEYLEKVIQVPILLPQANEQEVEKVLVEELNKIPHNTSQAEKLDNMPSIDIASGYDKNVFTCCIRPFVRTVRDIHRLCNVVLFKASILIGEVCFTDLVAISVLEILYPDLYRSIERSKRIMMSGINWDDPNQITFGDDEKAKTEHNRKYFQKRIGELLKYDERISREADKLAAITKAISGIFPRFGDMIGQSNAYGSSISPMVTDDLLRKNNNIAHIEKFDRYFSLNPNFIGVKRVDIFSALEDKRAFASFFQQKYNKGLAVEVLQEIDSMISDITADQAKFIACSFVEAANNESNEYYACQTFSSFHHKMYESLTLLIDKVDKNERTQFVIGLLELSTIYTLPSFAVVLGRTNLYFKRREDNQGATNDGLRIYKREYLTLANKFYEVVQKHIEKVDLFRVNDWNRIVYYLQQVDPQWIETYVIESLKHEENVLRWLECSVVTTELSDDKRPEYKVVDRTPSVPSDRIEESIHCTRSDDTFFSLPQPVQTAAAVHYLRIAEPEKYSGIVSQSAVDDLLSSWREKHQN